MRARVAQQDRLTLERLPAYAPEPNPAELLWPSLKKRKLANLAGDHVADTTEPDIHRINHNPQLPWSASPAPDSPSTHHAHRTNEKTSRRCSRISRQR
ncbi:hypothetical protein [Streptomyces sp. 3211]|uniref:hypothetical protein n=1 Tax=Streptomyces sp. 3211 TaxID=1964449 RepID=UPI0017B0E403|nr:hypothetical protein [Streptomyces sp. 3211]